MKCPQCQAENRIDRLYCDQCGATLEHKLEDVRAAIDKEIRTEKADAAARGAKWLLAVSIILFFLGRGFRGCYKNLPENDIVAFASAPTVQIDDRITVKVTNFGVAIPKPKAIRPPTPAADKRNVEKELQDEAYRRAAVILKHRGSRTPITGVLLGELIRAGPRLELVAPAPIDANRAHHRDQPGAHGSVAPKRGHRAKRLDERLLGQIVSVRPIVTERVGKPANDRDMRPYQSLERRSVPCLSALNQGLVIRRGQI